MDECIDKNMIDKDEYPGFNLYDLSDRIRMRGWQIAAYSMPPNREDLVIMRILVRSPFDRRTNIALGVAYLVVLLALAWVSSHALRVEAAGSGDAPGLIFSVGRELVQPFRW